MSVYLIESTMLEDIADAIREKTGSAESILTEDMANEIRGIEAGGGDADALIDGTITEVNSGATKVGAYAFHHYSNLTSANLPNATRIDSYAFAACPKLTSVAFPSATVIGSNAFQSCSKLTGVEFPSAKIINSNAFESCSKIASINFPNAESIGSYAFMYCYALTNVELPKATTIGYSGFNTCRAITSADLGNTTSVANYAFSSCYSLKSVILRSETVCKLDSPSAFDSCYHVLGTYNATYNPNSDKDGYIYVPANLVNSYKSATNWSTYASQIRAIGGDDAVNKHYLCQDMSIPDYENCGTVFQPALEAGKVYYCEFEGSSPWDYISKTDLGPCEAWLHDPDADGAGAHWHNVDGEVMIDYNSDDGWHFQEGSTVTSGKISIYERVENPSEQLPTPDLMIDMGDLGISNFGAATSATIYCTADGGAEYGGDVEWTELGEYLFDTTEFDLVWITYDTVLSMCKSKGFSGEVFLSVITHADGYADSARSVYTSSFGIS